MEIKKILLIVVCVIGYLSILSFGKKTQKPYHSEVYSSWEEEQLDECRADINYLYHQIDKLHLKDD